MSKEKRFVRELATYMVNKVPSHERDDEKERCFAIVRLVRQGLVSNEEAVTMLVNRNFWTEVSR